MRLVLHAGLRETGDAYLRGALRKLSPQLRRHRVAVIDDLSGDAGGAATVVLSSAGLVGDPFDPQPEAGLGRAIEALAPERVTVVLHVRRQDRLMEAIYLAQVAAGSDLTFDQAFPRAAEPLLDYGALAERVAAVPGVDEVRVRPFELSGAGGLAFLHDFLGVAGLGDRLDLGVVGGRAVHAGSLSRRGMEVARAMNAHLETDEERRLVRRFVQEQFPVREERDTRVMRKALRPEVLAAHRPLNEAFFARWLPELPADSYSHEEGTAALGSLLPPVEAARPSGRRAAVETVKDWGRRRLPPPLRRKLASALRRVAPRLS